MAYRRKKIGASQGIGREKVGDDPASNTRKGRVFSVIHSISDIDSVVVNYSFILVPTGKEYNRRLYEAKIGDTVRFVGGVERKIEDMAFIDVNSSVFRNLCILRYGATSSNVMKRWRLNAIDEGYSPKAVDPDTAIIIWYRTDETSPLVKIIKDEDTELQNAECKPGSRKNPGKSRSKKNRNKVQRKGASSGRRSKRSKKRRSR